MIQAIRSATRPGLTKSKAGSGLAALERLCAIGVLVHVAIASGIWNTDAGDSTDRQRDTAHAEQDAASIATLPTREYMIGAYGGSPYTYDSDVRVNRPGTHEFTAKDVTWRGEPFIDPIYYGVRVQRWFEGGRTGTMLDFTHSKALANLDRETHLEGLIKGAPAPEGKKLKKVFRRLEFSHGHNMLTLNGLLRLADLHPKLSPYIGIGAGINMPHTEIHLKGDKKRTYEYQYTGPAFQALAGLEVRLPKISLFFEYKFTFADYVSPLTGRDSSPFGLFADLYRQAADWWAGEPLPGGTLTTKLISHQLISGIGVRFAPHAIAPASP